MFPANSEPSLEELLTDPVARLLMHGDGLQPEQVRSCIGAVQRKLRLARIIERRAAKLRGNHALPAVRSSEWASPCFCAR